MILALPGYDELTEPLQESGANDFGGNRKHSSGR